MMMRTRLVVLLLACAAAAACSRKEKAPQFSPGNSPSASADDDEDSSDKDPCSLLDTADVAKAIGPLAGPPYRGTWGPDASSSSCRYDTKDYRRIIIDVDWTGGAQAMKFVHFGRGLTDKASQAETKMGVTVLKSGDTLVGDWDEIAMAPMQCCTLDALRGDQHVQLDYTGTRLDPVAAGVLLNSAIKRLDHPLAITGEAGMASAAQRLAEQAKDTLIDVCSLVSQKDAEAIIGAKLDRPPDHGQSKGISECYYWTPLPNAPTSEMKLAYEIDMKEWHDAHASFQQDLSLIAGLAGGMRRQITGDTTAQAPAFQSPPGPWDEAGPSTNMGLAAVKRNVLLVGSTTGDPKKEQALLAKAISALPAPAPQ
jgi:hypothetical protein